MQYFTTKIVDHKVANKVNLTTINNLLGTVKVPDFLKRFHEIAIALVAKDPNDYKFDAWADKNKFFMTIPLDFNTVFKSSEEEVTSLSLEKYREYLTQLDEDVLQQNNRISSDVPIFQFLELRKIEISNPDPAPLLQALNAYRLIIGPGDFLAEQLHLLLSRIEEELGPEQALLMSKEIITLLTSPDGP